MTTRSHPDSRRVLVIAAHPDDEVVGLGGQLPAMGEVHIVHVTDGAPQNMRDAQAHGFRSRREYSDARRREVVAALALANVGEERLSCLEIPDQEASLQMPAIARRIMDCIATLQPRAVYTHPYEGGHPDHDATALAVHSACRLLGSDAPELREFTSYHARGGSIVTYDFLPYSSVAVQTVPLSIETQGRKSRMIECFVTQRATLAAFHSGVERWRRAPGYDFTRPPHPGTLYYDQFDWGMRSGDWRRLAAAALAELGLDRAAAKPKSKGAA